MDVGTNKTRKDTRAVVSLVARYRSPNTFEYVEEACCDVSLGGMFIRSKDPAAAGTLLKLECESGVGEHIRGVARVVWLRAQQNEYGPSGMGVKFVKLDPESRDLITRLVQELAEAGIEAPSMSSAPEHRGKPPTSRGTSSTPAAAEPPPPPPRPKAAEISATRPLSSSPPRNDVAVFHRASDRAAATPPPPPPSSSRPSPHPGMSSRPAPSNALLAHTKVEPLEIDSTPRDSELAPLQALGRDLAPPQEVGRDLAPLQAMVRSARVSSAPPAEERSGRAFWLVAGAVVALGAIVALLSMRAAREPEPGELQANADSTAVVEAPTEGTEGTMNRADPAPTADPGAEGAGAQPSDPGTELAARPEGPADQLADPEQVAAALPAAANDDVAQAQVGTPEATAPSAQVAEPGATSEGAVVGESDSAGPSATAPQPSAAAQTTQPDQPNAPTGTGTAQPSAAAQTTQPAQANARTQPSPTATTPGTLPPPVVRIVPADQASPPSAAGPSSAPAAPKENAAPSGTAAAVSTQNKVAPPPLPPGEIARVITFTSRPSGASVFVADQTVTTPGELNLGAMPARIRVTAQKEGFESSTIWINNTTEFQKVGGVMKREVHFVLRALPTPPEAAATPGQPAPAAPKAAPVQPPTSSAAAQPQAATTGPGAPTPGPSVAPSQP